MKKNKKEIPVLKTRERKFRGKDLETGKWVYGFYYESEVAGFVSYIRPKSPNPQHDGIIIAYAVLPSSVGQLIGYTRDGKEFYEGDIIEHRYGTHEIVWVGGSSTGFEYQVSDMSYTDWANHDWYEGFTVVANIHDNPDFLKELELKKIQQETNNKRK